MYLNKVYFGDGLYGVEAASRGYFGKHASELTVDEAALLAGSDPVAVELRADGQPRSRDRAPQRRAADDGGVRRDRQDAVRAREARRQVKLTNGLEMKETFGLYFKEQVRRELVERFGWPRASPQGGLRVYTTLDTDAAAGGREDRRGRPGEHRASPRLPAPERAATPANAPRRERLRLPAGRAGRDGSRTTGAVRAMVGGRDFNESRFNRATQAKRQTGSAFKPFVYAAALEAGYSPGQRHRATSTIRSSRRRASGCRRTSTRAPTR